MPTSSRSTSDAGSAVVEFVLLGLPLLLLAGFVAQVVGVGYLKSVTMDAAVEGASYAALANRDIGAGEAKALEVLQRLGIHFPAQAIGTRTLLGNREAVEMSVAVEFPFTQLPVTSRGLAWLEK